MDPAIGPPANSMPNQPHSMLRCPVHPVSSAFQHLAASPTFQCYSVTRLERLKWVLHVYQIRMNFTRRYVQFSYLIYNICISYICLNLNVLNSSHIMKSNAYLNCYLINTWVYSIRDCIIKCTFFLPGLHGYLGWSCQWKLDHSHFRHRWYRCCGTICANHIHLLVL